MTENKLLNYSLQFEGKKLNKNYIKDNLLTSRCDSKTEKMYTAGRGMKTIYITRLKYHNYFFAKPQHAFK